MEERERERGGKTKGGFAMSVETEID